MGQNTKEIQRMDHGEIFTVIYDAFAAVKGKDSMMYYRSLYSLFYMHSDSVKMISMGGTIVYRSRMDDKGKLKWVLHSVAHKQSVPTLLMEEYRLMKNDVRNVLRLVYYLFTEDGYAQEVKRKAIHTLLTSNSELLERAILDSDIFYNFRNQEFKGRKLIRCEAFACKSQTTTQLYELK